ncbi:hypothetical protein SBA4_1360027 [Candidatus Sulfopaludibacter sp. SbA4]|nr:hypothetical protein SBA4_1360027 [Candidatus Sulfopaludibacter sp. SbA4]
MNGAANPLPVTGAIPGDPFFSTPVFDKVSPQTRSARLILAHRASATGPTIH